MRTCPRCHKSEVKTSACQNSANVFYLYCNKCDHSIRGAVSYYNAIRTAKAIMARSGLDKKI